MEEHTSPDLIQELDVRIPMRDGVRLAADVYRPASPGTFPVLYAAAFHNKDLQRPELADVLPPQPAWSSLWYGILEAGDTRRLVANGYVHVVVQPRGVGKSEGQVFQEEWDHYDTIEWIARQPWSNGKVGMIGISAFAGEQWRAAAQHPPALKAIFPYDACGAYGGPFGFREMHPGGVIQTMPYLIDSFSVVHEPRGIPGELPPAVEEAWRAAMANPDYRMYTHLWNVLTQKGQRSGMMFQYLVHPYCDEEEIPRSESAFERISIPAYTGSGAYAYTYKMHWQGAQHWYQNIDVPKKLLFTGPSHLERPFHELHDEILRWYDHWLKGEPTGIMEEPPVKVWVMGENKWRYGRDWPLPETRWEKFHLHSWERLVTTPPMDASRTSAVYREPDAFVQMPPTHTRRIQALRYMTEPLAEEVLVIGPISLTLYASIDAEDTNWIVTLKDVGPDVSVRTGREGETHRPENLPERELTRGWLKASHRAVDPQRSRPGVPWHPLTRQAQQAVVPGEINEYQIEILATANLFRAGHRICVEISSLDLPTGVAGATNTEYIPNHVCSSRTVLHRIHHDAAHPSHLLLPIIPAGG